MMRPSLAMRVATLLLALTFPLGVARAQGAPSKPAAAKGGADAKATPKPQTKATGGAVDDLDLDLGVAGEGDKPATAGASTGTDPSGRPEPALVAPSLEGLSGLVRVVTGDIGAPHTFRIALHLEMLSASDFLVSGDSHSRFQATLAANYTPWRFLEFFANFRSAANSNDRPNEPGRVDPSVIFALGDFTFGAKGAYPVLKSLTVGANIGLTLLNSVGGVSIDGDSTSFYAGLLTSFDIGKLSAVPARLHFNFGFMLDNSGSLADFSSYRQTSRLPSLQVQKFSLGIKPNRLAIKFGADMPLQRWTHIGVTPLIELNLDVATGLSDEDFDNTAFVQPPADRPLTADNIAGRLSSTLTLGVRVNPIAGLNVLLAMDIGLQSPGFGYGPPVLPWNFILGLSYAYDPMPQVKTVVQEKVRTVVRKVEPQLGTVRGRVIDAKSLEPIEGAIVTFPGRDLTGLSSDPDGGFLSYRFKGGTLPIMVRHPRYAAAKASAKVVAGAELKIEIKLVPKPPQVGQLSGSVVDLRNNGVAASVMLSGPQNLRLTASPTGSFEAKLKPGSYTVRIEADGYLRKDGRFTVQAGGTANLAFTISPVPRRSLVQVTKRAIIIRRQVHFATATADIKEDSRQLLDQIAHVLLSNPQIARIEIQGHTDNRGSRVRNMTLSQARAEAVRDHLVRSGVRSERLVAKGYGPTQPKRPNITARNRAANRRVEFRILKQ